MPQLDNPFNVHDVNSNLDVGQEPASYEDPTIRGAPCVGTRRLRVHRSNTRPRYGLFLNIDGWKIQLWYYWGVAPHEGKYSK